MKQRILALFLAITLFVCAVPGAFAADYPPEAQLDILTEVDALIREEGLESSLEDRPLARAMEELLGSTPDMEGLLTELETDPLLYEYLLAVMLSGYDQYTMYIPSGNYSAVYAPETNYVGIGVTIQAHAKGALVTEVNLMGPAAAAGIRAGDILIQGNGQALEGMDVSAISDLLRGEAGTDVTVTLLRGKETLTFTLTRRALAQLNYSCAPLDEDVFYMKWSRFQDDGSYLLFRLHLNQILKDGYESLILDLRGNPGGDLDLAFSMASDFMSVKTTFFRIGYRDPRGREEMVYKYITAQGDGVTIPNLYVLVDGQSASASEIMACGLRQGANATVIGQTTFGKARAQQHYVLDNDAGIVLTTMVLLPLEGEDYQDVGLTPDVEVKNKVLKTKEKLSVPTDVALAPWSCSDNGEALNRALVALGLLKELPEKPYQVNQDTLNAVNRLQAVYQLPDSHPGVGIPSLLLVNQLLQLQQAGRYEQDIQLDTAIQMAKDALKGE